MISMEKNFNKLLLTALLIGAVGSAIAGTPCGTNLEYELDGTTLVLTSPDPTQAATINSQAFMGRMDFTDVVIPDNVTEINTRAFKNCTALTSVVIPPSVTLVGEQAFYDCSALVSVLCRPTSAPTLVADAFTGCHASLQICVPKLGGTDGYNSSDWNTSYGEKLNLCFLDERDDEETTAGQISTFRTQSTPAVFLFRPLWIMPSNSTSRCSQVRLLLLAHRILSNGRTQARCSMQCFLWASHGTLTKWLMMLVQDK